VRIDRERLRRAAREARRIALLPAIGWIAYLVVSAIFGVATARVGLVWPDDIDLGLLLLGVAALALRVVALFVLPALVVYRVSSRLLRGAPPVSRGAHGPR
jgi:hypothetical protein